MSTPTARRPRSLHSTSFVPEPIIPSRASGGRRHVCSGHTWIHATVKHKLTGCSVAQNEVARDVWRPVAPVIPNVRRPVAVGWEAKNGGGFGSEGGGRIQISSKKKSSISKVFLLISLLISSSSLKSAG